MENYINMAEDIAIEMSIAAWEEEQAFEASDDGVIENYHDLYFNEGFPRCPRQVVRSHAKRIDRVYWKKFYDFETTDKWYGFKMLEEAALLEKRLTLPQPVVYGPEEAFPF